ncbi:hypothetical protein FPOAC2_03359 [Fusarium poae]|uniref:Uncharacterized protein n=1 Tax=Fusarium poae TaxID=36050 RepID=A0A1B8B8U2_FUSPO|nr:hypothetical protein FPOAC1_003252 [Fusarium poae]KAG8677239.1 hypothetical protein FPOAC1_003252 [Fusarium poae]OBS29153.1 hypothetical protein FPOA_03090 [Fusarium poae]
MVKVKSMEQRTSQQRAPEKRARHDEGENKDCLVFGDFTNSEFDGQDGNMKQDWRVERSTNSFWLSNETVALLYFALRCVVTWAKQFECDNGRNARRYEGAFH